MEIKTAINNFDQEPNDKVEKKFSIEIANDGIIIESTDDVKIDPENAVYMRSAAIEFNKAGDVFVNVYAYNQEEPLRLRLDKEGNIYDSNNILIKMAV